MCGNCYPYILGYEDAVELLRFQKLSRTELAALRAIDIMVIARIGVS